MAELPADAEMVSEDELPSNKSKRKIDESYDPNSPTETSNKRAKSDTDGKY